MKSKILSLLVALCVFVGGTQRAWAVCGDNCDDNPESTAGAVLSCVVRECGGPNGPSYGSGFGSNNGNACYHVRTVYFTTDLAPFSPLSTTCPTPAFWEVSYLNCGSGVEVSNWLLRPAVTTCGSGGGSRCSDIGLNGHPSCISLPPPPPLAPDGTVAPTQCAEECTPGTWTCSFVDGNAVWERTDRRNTWDCKVRDLTFVRPDEGVGCGDSAAPEDVIPCFGGGNTATIVTDPFFM